MTRKLQSWLGRIFPYINMLEVLVQDQAEQLEKAEERYQVLQERFFRMSTGYGLKDEVPSQVEVEKHRAEMMNTAASLHEMLLQREAESERAFNDRVTAGAVPRPAVPPDVHTFDLALEQEAALRAIKEKAGANGR